MVVTVRFPGAPAVPDRDARVARELISLGGTAVERVDEGLRTWLPWPEAPREVAAAVRARAAGLVPGHDPAVEWSRAADRDWTEAWRRGLEPRRVGRRLVVAPAWTRPSTSEGEVPVLVEPGRAFGTGEHGSTRGALRLLEDALDGLAQEAADADVRVLDVGTGSGVLAAAAALLGASSVLAIDKDEAAVEAARRTLAENGVARRVTLLRAEATPALLRLLPPTRFGVVCANLHLELLLELLPALREVTAPGGSLIAAGVLAEESGRMEEAAREGGWSLGRVDRDEGWWGVRLRRPAERAPEP